VFPNTRTLTYNIDSVVDVPCFKCLIHKLVGPYSCHPETCRDMEYWLLRFIWEEKTNIAKAGKELQVNQNVAPKL